MKIYNIKKLLAGAIITAACIVTGCNGSTTTETTTTLSASGPHAAENETAQQNAYPMPEGWSMEKIAALIEIDGKPLKFPCTIEEFESMSEKIRVGEPDEYFNHYCKIFYNDIEIGVFDLNAESNMCELIDLFVYDFYNTEVIDAISFCGYKIDNAADTSAYLNSTLGCDDEFSADSGNIFRKYFQTADEKLLTLSTVSNGDKTEMITIAVY